MSFQVIDNISVWGEVLDDALRQMQNCQRKAARCALMADHHIGYAVPIGGVVAYKDKVSPSGVGFDIACGNKAVRLDIPAEQVRRDIKVIMDDIFSTLSFGIGMKNNERVDHPLFHDAVWEGCDALRKLGLKKLAQEQLGTVGSGNHYIDIFVDEKDRVWVGIHFGSRGFGHRIATYFIKAGGGRDGMHVDPVVLEVRSDLAQEYIVCMKLAGRYAYAGRDWVCDRVARILGANIMEEVHNHHNFAWEETHGGEEFWVVRKGATPAFPGQKGFVGGSMGDEAVIVEGIDSTEARRGMYSTVHGAGRLMSRTAAAGHKRGRHRLGGKITREMMLKWVHEKGVELRGAGTDESPHCYKRLPEVLKHHEKSIRILHTLTPIGVAMAGEWEEDPFKD
jgi:tRNA-splicing ligase RtcB